MGIEEYVKKVAKKKEANLYFARMSIQGILMAKDALKGYAANLKQEVSREECPIASIAKNKHYEITQFLTGQNSRSWKCPFCGEEFDRW